ncbi:MAG: LacI family DNA-binding transcriptional regulator, partial [Terriglobales bacterium]
MRRGRPKDSMVTIRDVARESGFSSTTVSIVLNDAPLARYIPPVTKNRIQQAAKRLGYRPNLFARSLRSNRSHTVGVMVFDMIDPYCTYIMRGIENSLYQASYLPIVTDVQNDRTRFERYLEMLLGRRVEGLILLANWLFTDINLLADLQKNSIPSVVIGRELNSDAVSSVIVDNEAGGAAAMEHLYSLGHRQIAVIRGPKPLSDSAPRWKGVRNFAHARGLELDARLT